MLRKCKLRKNLCLQLITLAIAKICMSLCAVTAEPSMSSVVELCGWIKMQPDRQQQQHAERIYSTPALSPWRHTNKEYCGRKMSVIRTHTHTHTQYAASNSLSEGKKLLFVLFVCRILWALFRAYFHSGCVMYFSLVLTPQFSYGVAVLLKYFAFRIWLQKYARTFWHNCCQSHWHLQRTIYWCAMFATKVVKYKLNIGVQQFICDRWHIRAYRFGWR